MADNSFDDARGVGDYEDVEFGDEFGDEHSEDSPFDREERGMLLVRCEILLNRVTVWPSCVHTIGQNREHKVWSS